jgi:hypothetical protein
MKLWQMNALAALVCGIAFSGCSSDDDDDSTAPGTGGTHAGASSGGKAGKGGRAGSGGTGGTVGTAGGNNAGTGGDAGSGSPSSGGAGGEGATVGASGSSGEGGSGGEGVPAAVDVTGAWGITQTIPADQVGAGTYTGTFTLLAKGDGVTGTALWSNGATSTMLGSVHGRRIHLDREDESGFRATYDGNVAASGATMNGTGANDPASPGGSDATFTWSGTLP